MLVSEARRLKFPLWILRRSIEAYRAPRVIRIDGGVFRYVHPKRSLTAGSSFATTEMRVVRIHIVDRALRLAPLVHPKLYVDDLSAEVAGSENIVATQLPAFTNEFCRLITSDGMEVSGTKS